MSEDFKRNALKTGIQDTCEKMELFCLIAPPTFSFNAYEFQSKGDLPVIIATDIPETLSSRFVKEFLWGKQYLAAKEYFLKSQRNDTNSLIESFASGWNLMQTIYQSPNAEAAMLQGIEWTNTDMICPTKNQIVACNKWLRGLPLVEYSTSQCLILFRWHSNCRPRE